MWKILFFNIFMTECKLLLRGGMESKSMKNILLSLVSVLPRGVLYCSSVGDWLFITFFSKYLIIIMLIIFSSLNLVESYFSPDGNWLFTLPMWIIRLHQRITRKVSHRNWWLTHKDSRCTSLNGDGEKSLLCLPLGLDCFSNLS